LNLASDIGIGQDAILGACESHMSFDRPDALAIPEIELFVIQLVTSCRSYRLLQ
jgi:hypothetical protein